MYELSTTMELEGTAFELLVGNFKSLSEVVTFIEKYGEELKFISYHIRRTEA